jgi:hypothetical protein
MSPYTLSTLSPYLLLLKLAPLPTLAPLLTLAPLPSLTRLGRPLVARPYRLLPLLL